MKSLALLAGMALVVDGLVTLAAVWSALADPTVAVWPTYLVASIAAAVAAALLAVVLRSPAVRIGFVVTAIGWALIAAYSLRVEALFLPAAAVTAIGGLVTAITVLATGLRPDVARLVLALVGLVWAAWALVLVVPSADVGLGATVIVVRGVLAAIGGLVVIGTRGPISGTAPRHPLPWA